MKQKIEPMEVGKWFEITCECNCKKVFKVYADNKEEAINLCKHNLENKSMIYDINVKKIINIKEKEN